MSRRSETKIKQFHAYMSAIKWLFPVEQQEILPEPKYEPVPEPVPDSDLCTIKQTIQEFALTENKIKLAIKYGVLNPTYIPKGKKRAIFLSRSEIQQKLDIIRKGDSIFYRILTKNLSNSVYRERMQELMASGLTAVNELERHGIPSSVIQTYYHLDIKDFRPSSIGEIYCYRSDVYVSKCEIECNFKEMCF